MSDNLFDKHIKDKLRNYESPVNENLWNKISFDKSIEEKLGDYESDVPDDLWNKIYESEEIERRPVFWLNTRIWRAAVIVGLLIGIGALAMWKELKSDSSLKTGKNNKESVVKTQPLPDNNPNNNTTPSDKITETPQEPNIASNPPAQTPDQSGLNNTGTGTNAETNNLFKNNRQKTFSLKNTGANRNIIGDDVNTNSGSQVSTDINNPGNLSLLNNNVIQAKDDEAQDKKFLAQTTVAPFSLLNLNKLRAKQHFDAVTSFKLACPEEKRPTWFLEVYGSPDYTMETIIRNGVSDAYLQKKDSSEKMAGGFTVGARVSRYFGEHFIMKTGLQYAQINQSFKVRTENEIKTTTVITTRGIVRGPGDTLFVKDTSTLTQVGYAVHNTKNSYKSIEIPLIAGYETGTGNWKFGFNGGVILNASSWFTGETYDTSYHIVPLSAKNYSNGVYNSNLNISLYASVSVIRRIGDAVELFAEPYFRYSLSNSATSYMGYSQRFNAAGLSLGIRYQLNNKSSASRL